MCELGCSRWQDYEKVSVPSGQLVLSPSSGSGLVQGQGRDLGVMSPFSGPGQSGKGQGMGKADTLGLPLCSSFFI